MRIAQVWEPGPRKQTHYAVMSHEGWGYLMCRGPGASLHRGLRETTHMSPVTCKMCAAQMRNRPGLHESAEVYTDMERLVRQ